MAGGRPTKFKEEYTDLAYRFALLGATDVEMAAAFGVTEKTFNNWKHKHPEFLQSIKRGKLQADAEVAESLFKRAKGFVTKETKVFHNGRDHEPTQVEIEKHYPPDSVAGFFWLKNRQPALWRERREEQHDDDPLGNLLHLTMPELLREFANLRAAIDRLEGGAEAPGSGRESDSAAPTIN